MRKFNEAFAPYGLPKTAIKPSYGMAEATLFVSTTHPSDEAKVMYVDRDELNAGRMVQVDQDAPGAVAQVACGAVSRSQWATIVDPETAAERPDGYVGEIWLHGDNIGQGYWGREQETAETFTQQAAPAPARGLARRGRAGRRELAAHRRLRRVRRRRALHHRPRQGSGDRRRP